MTGPHPDPLTERPHHSKLGASGAERWMKCPGSVTLLQYLGMDESEEPDYTKQGTAMHEAAAACLRSGEDAWEQVGEWFGDVLFTPELADPVQIYLDYCRSLFGTPYIEYAISSPVHPLFYGTTDFAAVNPNLIHIVDLKGGAGIMVEVDETPQLPYYAFGLIDGLERAQGYEFDGNTPVRLAIVQPRGWHEAGKIRTHDTTVFEIKAWVHGVLVPAMLATEYDDSLDAGEHCRFCPAKLVCPLMKSLFGAAAVANPKIVGQFTDEMLSRDYALASAVKHYIKALDAEATARLTRGAEIEGLKLVRKKADRVWTPGADALARAKFGAKALTTPELLSPAQMEKVAGKDWVKEFAHAPDTGYTVALADDKRAAVKVQKLSERFAGAIAEQANEGVQGSDSGTDSSTD